MKIKIFALVMSLGLLSAALAGCGASDGGGLSSSQEPSSSSAAPESAVSSDAGSSEEVSSEAVSSQESAPEESAPADSGALGDYEVAILSARKAADYEGKPAIIISYRFTNNAEDNKMFLTSVSGKAFQDGIQLDTAIITGDDSYNSDNQMKEIKTGATIEVDAAYLLDSETADVEVELSELISLSDDMISKTFKLSDLS